MDVTVINNLLYVKKENHLGERCGKNNPAEVHTCSPGYHIREQELVDTMVDNIKSINDLINNDIDNNIL